jgi:hypothetical protein
MIYGKNNSDLYETEIEEKTLCENVSTSTIKKITPIQTDNDKSLEILKMNSKASKKSA